MILLSPQKIFVPPRVVLAQTQARPQAVTPGEATNGLFECRSANGTTVPVSKWRSARCELAPKTLRVQDFDSAAPRHPSIHHCGPAGSHVNNAALSRKSSCEFSQPEIGAPVRETAGPSPKLYRR